MIERQRRRVAAAHPEFIFFLADDETGSFVIDDECGNSFFAFRLIGIRHHDGHIADTAVRDKIFTAVENVCIAIVCCGREHSAGITAGRRFRQRPRTDLPSSGKIVQIFFLLFFIAE